MNSSIIKKIQIGIISLISLIVFFGAQVHPATSSGEKQSILSAFGMSSLAFFVYYMFVSDYMYNSLKENGLDINYKLFQIVGLFVVAFILYIVSNAYIFSHM